MAYGETLHSRKLFPYWLTDRPNLSIPKITSPIVCQLAGRNTEDTPVVCCYSDATPEDLPVIPLGKGTESVSKFSPGTTLIFAKTLDISPSRNNVVRGVDWMDQYRIVPDTAARTINFDYSKQLRSPPPSLDSHKVPARFTRFGYGPLFGRKFPVVNKNPDTTPINPLVQNLGTPPPSSRFSIHLEISKMYQDLKQRSW